MALVIGTNCGFCSSRPTSDPSASASNWSNTEKAIKGTSPAGAGKVIEIGIWIDSDTSDCDMDLGIYTHNGGTDLPDSLVGKVTVQKGTGAGWKYYTTDITISESTTYWIAAQIDSTAASNYAAVAGGRRSIGTAALGSLQDTWTNTGAADDQVYALYALTSSGAATNPSINIGDAWKEIDWANCAINIGDAWKTIVGVSINIGDVWKEVYAPP